MAADFSGALCIGRWDIFDSNDDNEFPFEEEAKDICAQCPLIEQCYRENKDLFGVIVAGMTDQERKDYARKRRSR